MSLLAMLPAIPILILYGTVYVMVVYILFLLIKVLRIYIDKNQRD